MKNAEEMLYKNINDYVNARYAYLFRLSGDVHGIIIRKGAYYDPMDMQNQKEIAKTSQLLQEAKDRLNKLM